MERILNFMKNNKLVIILLMIFLIFLSYYLINNYLIKDSYNIGHLENDYIPKVYDVNEYSVVQVTDNDLVSIYLNNFKKYLLSDINYAYELLNEEYRNKKFGNINNFINYAESLNYNLFNVEKYLKDNKEKTIRAYLEDGQLIIFKYSSIMEYEVYLDEDTVEIR